jgi:hypothetical protein
MPQGSIHQNAEQGTVNRLYYFQQSAEKGVTEHGRD